MYILYTSSYLPKFISLTTDLLLFITNSQYLFRLANMLYCKALVDAHSKLSSGLPPQSKARTGHPQEIVLFEGVGLGVRVREVQDTCFLTRNVQFQPERLEKQKMSLSD